LGNNWRKSRRRRRWLLDLGGNRNTIKSWSTKIVVGGIARDNVVVIRIAGDIVVVVVASIIVAFVEEVIGFVLVFGFFFIEIGIQRGDARRLQIQHSILTKRIHSRWMVDTLDSLWLLLLLWL